MAKEILAIKEDYLREFIEVLERGITASPDISVELMWNLEKWIELEKEYIERLNAI